MPYARYRKTLSLLLSGFSILLATVYFINMHAAAPIYRSIYFFTSYAKDFAGHIIPSIPSENSNHPLVNLAWKTWPSSSPLPSSTAHSNFLSPTPQMVKKLNMSIRAEVQPTGAYITVVLSDEAGTAISGAQGFIQTNEGKTPLPATDKTGTTSAFLPTLYPGQNIAIHESANDLSVTGNLVATQ